MDKVTINNQVVLMRKYVKQAKIRAINKYIKEIRLLQNRKGNDDEAAKHKRKAERLITKVAILRKIRPDAVSRKALAKEKDWDVVLKEKNIALEEQCYAMLANYAPIQTEVAKFHKKHWDLVPKIAVLFKNWEQMSKNPMAKQEKKKAKQLQKNMKHLKLDKNNPNATPINIKHKVNISENKNIPNNETTLNAKEYNKRTDVEDTFSDNNDELNCSQIQDNPIALEDVNESDVDSKMKFKQNKITQQEAKRKISLKANSKCQKSKIGFNNSVEEDLEGNQILNSDHEENDSEESSNNAGSNNAGSYSENDTSDEENQDSDFDSDSKVKAVIQERKGNVKKHPILKTQSPVKPQGIKEVENMESDIDSDAKDMQEDIKNRKVIVKKQPNAKPQMPVKHQSIQAKLKAIADGSQKEKLNDNNIKPKMSSAKKSELNKMKAVTLLNLNDLQDLDEIPIERKNDSFFLGKGGDTLSESEDSIEETESNPEEVKDKKRKKDSFFLGKGGEVLSESDNEDSNNLARDSDSRAFKKSKFDSFNKRSTTDGEFFQRRFQGDARQNRNGNFRESDNGFQRNKRNSGFDDKRGSFNKSGKPGFQFSKDKRSMDNDRFKSDKKDKSFGDSGSSKKHNYQEKNNKGHFQKNGPGPSSLKKSGCTQIGDDKPLHPSWEAKKKLKETAKAKFQGKRMVFGD